MQRFNCFNNIMQNNSSTDEDDKDEEDDNANEPDDEGDVDADASSKASTVSAEDLKIEVVLPEVNKIDSQFADSGYWKVDSSEDELDDLLADYE